MSKGNPTTVFVVNEIVDRVSKQKNTSNNSINRVKLEIARKYSLKQIPSHSEILRLTSRSKDHQLRSIFRTKKVRSISGIQVVAVMSQPHNCPHGKCTYCPSFPDIPESYTGYEPSSMRGLQNGYDPYLQVSKRVNQLRSIGHNPCKVELIIQGGTFPATSKRYQEWFVRRCIDALTGQYSNSLEEAKQAAEQSLIRNVGITLETRPDKASKREITFMLKLGVTRIDMGVQTLYNEVYRSIKRGHTVTDVKEAFKTAKNAGLKIVAHMMIGLPKMSPSKDLKAFTKLFYDQDFKPDMLKIYPCLVLRNSKLYDQWLKNKYKPYSLAQTVDLIAEIKKIVPPWIRIMRVQRDIPAWMITDGIKKSNLRQLALKKLEKQGYSCQCIRCREIGHKQLKDNLNIKEEEYTVSIINYKASNGEEKFISLNHPPTNTLIGFLRLRIPHDTISLPNINQKSFTIVRELHIFGSAIPIGEHTTQSYQHRGYGKALLKKAEEITLNEYNIHNIFITSGIGVRGYYRKLGYKLDDPYMSKSL